jgi:hypothetical protein
VGVGRWEGVFCFFCEGSVAGGLGVGEWVRGMGTFFFGLGLEVGWSGGLRGLGRDLGGGGVWGCLGYGWGCGFWMVGGNWDVRSGSGVWLGWGLGWCGGVEG